MGLFLWTVIKRLALFVVAFASMVAVYVALVAYAWPIAVVLALVGMPVFFGLGRWCLPDREELRRLRVSRDVDFLRRHRLG